MALNGIPLDANTHTSWTEKLYRHHWSFNAKAVLSTVYLVQTDFVDDEQLRLLKLEKRSWTMEKR